MAVGVAEDEAPPKSREKLTFLDLPAETQQDIISLCSHSDLICIALVSKHFHELASAQLYRNFHIVFPDDDDLNFDSPIDGLAGGLDTFTTSEYNYAKHLKDLSMDTLSAGSKGEHSYQPYLYNVSCGKFLNTLLFLTLKRARSLETFRWNIRVELSRPVFQELHRIKSLKRLHIRMQAGASYYMLPPPLPTTISNPFEPVQGHWPEQVSTPPPHQAPALPAVTPAFLPHSLSALSPLPSAISPPSALLPPSQPQPKVKAPKRGVEESKTLSGFSNLTSLVVLDIDELGDIVGELKTCVLNSFSTLNELQLSFSEPLASQSRKPSSDSDPDDSDVDDEFQVLPASQDTSYDASGPAKAFRAQEEQKVHEGVLGKIFDVETPPIKAPLELPVNKESTTEDHEYKEATESYENNPRENFVNSLRDVSIQLMTIVNGSSELYPSHLDILQTIEKAAKKYVESGGAANTGPNERLNIESDGIAKRSANESAEESSVPNDESSPQLANEEPGSASQTIDMADAAQRGVDGDTGQGGCLSSGREPSARYWRDGKEAMPEDIDMEHIGMIDELFDDSTEEASTAIHNEGPKANTEAWVGTQRPQATSSGSDMPEPSAKPVPSEMGCSETDHHTDRDKLKQLHDGFSQVHLENHAAMSKLNRTLREDCSAQGQCKVDAEPGEVGRLVQDHEGQSGELTQPFDNGEERRSSTANETEMKTQTTTKAKPGENEPSKRSMDDYVRDTRGFALETLSIHLIPVKASVLSRAINLQSLKSLTLLNVGNQAPIWTLLSKENRVHPLALRSVFTDNVSVAFLNCVGQLHKLDDLFMLERSAKHRPEVLAPRSIISIDQIRRLALSKHIHHLKRLMIKDEGTNSIWDVNEKTMLLICTRGVQLEELALSLNIHTVHTFVQYMSSLVNLRALNILHFKNNDTCIWVMREILKFIVDNVSHYPELKLEWIAMEDDRVDRIVRQTDDSERFTADIKKMKARKGKGKGKGPMSVAAASTSLSGGFHNAFPIMPEIEMDSETDSDEDLFEAESRLRYRTQGPLQFYDVWGVKIFEKEIRAGKL